MMSPFEWYVVIGIMLMTTLEMQVFKLMGMNLYRYIFTALQTLAPFIIQDTDNDTLNEHMDIITLLLYILAYLMYPITLALIATKQ